MTTPEDKQPTATRVVLKNEGRVPVRPLGSNIQDHEQLRAILQQLVSAVDERNLAGTRKLKFSDLCDPNAGLIVRAKAIRVSPTGAKIPDLVEWLKTSVLSSTAKKALVLAGPGAGKTTVSLLSFLQMAHDYLHSDAKGSFPVLIDLRVERNAVNSLDYGTSDWLSRYIEIHYGRTVKTLCAEPTSNFRPVCVILDSLDEVLAGRSFKDIRSIVERYVFNESAVVLCRSHFYEQYLQYLPFVMDREIVSLADWEGDDIIAYINAFYKKARPDDHSANSAAFLDWMQASPSVEAILRVPIRLNMALDMYSDKREIFPRNRTLLQLYEAYVSWSINRERSRTDASLEDTYRLLEDVAWETYGERNATLGDTSATTERSLHDLLVARNSHASSDQIDAELSYILNLGLLSISGDQLPGRDHAVDFVHKSFQEYLVASRAAEAIRSSAQESASMCAIHLTPEISEFLKETIDRLNAHPRELAKVAAILIDAITRISANDASQSAPTEHIVDGRKRLMLEQLCYYLGNLESGNAQAFLMNLIDEEADEWIRRGIVVGLAFGGQHKPLEKYLAELRGERLSGGETPMNNMNIGFHLSFFGDQPYDPEYPDRDLGFEECGKTVARLVYQLGTETNRPNWKIDLYTLLDLRHRAVSERSYWAGIRTNISGLRKAYLNLSGRPETAMWIETADLAELLNDGRLCDLMRPAQSSDRE